MLLTFAKLKAPWTGRGKAKIHFTKAFHKLGPDERASITQQAMTQLRDEWNRAVAEQSIAFAAEDAVNAEGIGTAKA